MNIRRLPLDTEIFTVTTADITVASQPFGYDPAFQAVGRPWRHEFPHQSSTSDPETQPRFTVPLPEPAAGSVLAREFDATPEQESPPDADLSD